MRSEIVRPDCARRGWNEAGEPDPAPHGLFSSAWFGAWSDAMGAIGGWRPPTRFVVTRDDEGTVVSIVPVARQVVGGLPFLSLAGPYAPFRTAPCANPECTGIHESVLDALCGLHMGVALRLGPVEDTDPAIRGLMACAERRGWTAYLRDEAPEYVIDLPRDMEAFSDQVGASVLKKSRYFERRMAREGEFRIDRHTALEPGVWPSVLDDLHAVEQRSWLTGAGGDLLFEAGPAQRFWRLALEDEKLAANTAVWIAHFEGRPVSHVFAITAGGTCHIIANSYDEAVSQYSTGTILLRHVVEDAIAHGVRRINYGRGDSGYKTRWGAKPSRRLQDWLLLKPGVWSGPVLAGIRLLSRIRK